MLPRPIERLVLRTGLYDAIRSTYHAVGNRAYRDELRARHTLFAPFITRGSLVFDIGANHGEFTLVFRRLGARVICVEPNPALVPKLRARFGAAHVVAAAISETPGQALLHLGTDDNYSTIVDSWLSITAERGRLSAATVSVPVTTVDALIDRFGVPAFLKIDVEANEPAVIRGLSTPVPALMFEYQCPRLDDVPAMLDHLDQLARYRYGWLAGGTLVWGTRDHLLAHLHTRRAAGEQSGDVYARRL